MVGRKVTLNINDNYINGSSTGEFWDPATAVIGGEREVFYSFTKLSSSNTNEDQNEVVLAVRNGALSVNAATNIGISSLSIVYDGGDLSTADLNTATGLQSDISAYSGIGLTFSSPLGTLLTGSNSFKITARLYSGSFQYSTFDTTIQAGSPAAQSNFQFVDFSRIKSSGPGGDVDPANVTALVLNLYTNETQLDYSLINFYLFNPDFAPLPVTFGYFKGQSENGSTRLNWSTLTETDNKGFEVQRMNAGGDFTTIGFVPAVQPRYGVEKHYSYTDYSAPAGTSYYRLKQLDYSGTTDISRTIAVSNGQEAARLSLGFYPNPLPGGNDKVKVAVAGNRGPVSFTVLDVQGKAIRNWAKGNYTELNLGGLAPGLYFLRAQDEDGRQTVVQKMAIN